MTNSQIETRLGELVREERRITGEILSLIREAEARKLYLERGFPNLYEWLVRGYGYSHAAAYRRIQAARLVSALPEVEVKLKEGALNLTTAAMVQSALRKEERRSGERVSGEWKEKIVEEVQGKTERGTQAVLAAAFPEVAQRKESLRALNDHESKLTLILEKETVEALQQVQELLSHALPGASMAQVVAHLAKDFVKKKDPLARAEKKSAPDKRRVMSPRCQVFLKAQGKCEYQDPETGQVCGSRQQVEVDHRLPRALGGTDEPKNLRCLCRKHNQYEAERLLGSKVMEKFIN
jgi:hypothetical protein